MISHCLLLAVYCVARVLAVHLASFLVRYHIMTEQSFSLLGL